MFSWMYLLNLTALWKSIAFRLSKSISSKISSNFFFWSSLRTLKAFYSGIKQLLRNLFNDKAENTFLHRCCFLQALSLWCSWLWCHCLGGQGTRWFRDLVVSRRDARVCYPLHFWGPHLPWSWSHVMQAFWGLPVGHLMQIHGLLCWVLIIDKVIHYFSLQLISMLSFLSFFSASSTFPFAHWLMNYYSLICVVMIIYCLARIKLSRSYMYFWNFYYLSLE